MSLVASNSHRARALVFQRYIYFLIGHFNTSLLAFNAIRVPRRAVITIIALLSLLKISMWKLRLAILKKKKKECIYNSLIARKVA